VAAKRHHRVRVVPRLDQVLHAAAPEVVQQQPGEAGLRAGRPPGLAAVADPAPAAVEDPKRPRPSTSRPRAWE
jgi:hypothetical protein